MNHPLELTRYFPRPILDVSWAVGGNIQLRRAVEDGKAGMEFYCSDRHTTAVLNSPSLSYMDRRVIIQGYKTLYEFMKSGPVIIRPKLDLCHAMIDTSVPIQVNEYKQPFSVIGIEIPSLITTINQPTLVLVWKHNEDNLLTWMYDGIHNTAFGTIFGPGESRIEDRITKSASIADDDTEFRLMVTSTRIAINIGLLAGVKPTRTTELPPKVIRHRRANDERLNQLAARQAQEVVFRDLFIRSDSEPREYGISGKEQAQQRRRGHWKNVAHGPRFTKHTLKWINEYWTKDDDRDQTPVIILK